jgi:hypothetical protein
MEEYFDFMVQTQTNGKFSQLGELIVKLSDRQKGKCINHLHIKKVGIINGFCLKKLVLENIK